MKTSGKQDEAWIMTRLIKQLTDMGFPVTGVFLYCYRRVSWPAWPCRVLCPPLSCVTQEDDFWGMSLLAKPSSYIPLSPGHSCLGISALNKEIHILSV